MQSSAKTKSEKSKLHAVQLPVLHTNAVDESTVVKGQHPALYTSNTNDGTAVVRGQFQAVRAVGTLRNRSKKRKQKTSKFERRLTALGPLLKPEDKRIDFVLVHKKLPENVTNEGDRKLLQSQEDIRKRFEKALLKEGIAIIKKEIDDLVFVLLHCSFKRLCKEAERVKLEMPLRGCEKSEDAPGCLKKIYKLFETDNEVDFISTQFKMSKVDMFENCTNPTYFFRPALRSLLTYHIMINIDIRDDKDITESISRKASMLSEMTTDTMMYYNIKVVEECVIDFCSCCVCYPRDSDDLEDNTLSKVGLLYLLMKKNYIDAFILHEDSAFSKLAEKQLDEAAGIRSEEEDINLEIDSRKELDQTWTKFYKFQPLWKIRNYFGEKIGFYFAWVGKLVSSLWIPCLFGLACFFYGLQVSSSRSHNYDSVPLNITDLQKLKIQLEQLYNTVSGAFDNEVTPFFAILICLWGTWFVETWKRENARLAYKWDVDQYEENEPDRPEFFGTAIRKDPVTHQDNWFYPYRRQLLKFFISGSALIFMICLTFISAAAVVVYRVTISVDYCIKLSAAECIVMTNIVSAVLNAVSILILGKVYDKVAWKLTEWENHRTRTNFDDALIIKQFAFSFANSYTSCFYIAFFRGRFGGIFGLNQEYNDHCEGDSCMPQLSFQVLVLMVMKPMSKFAIDIIIPFIKYLWRSRPKCCQSNCCNNEVKNEKTDEQTIEQERHEVRLKHFLRKEHKKTNLGDFTLGEYTEKTILYGFQMLFAASFPLAPLIAIVIIYIDIHVDAKRLLWLNRRPIAFIAQDIGMWYSMLNFLNIVGVVTNGFLISFTSSWAQKYSLVTRLWICILFEHIVFAVKFCIAYLIPDVPKDVRLAIRKEKYEIAKMMDRSKNSLLPEMTAKASYDHKSLSESLNYADFPGDVTEKETSGKNHAGKRSHELPPVVEEEGNVTELGPNRQLSQETDLSLCGVTPTGVNSAFTSPTTSPQSRNGQPYHTREFIEESYSEVMPI